MTRPWWNECCVWIKAVKCPPLKTGVQEVPDDEKPDQDKPDPNDPCQDIEVYVHIDDVDEITFFNFGAKLPIGGDANSPNPNCCWKVDPDGERVVLPEGDNVFTYSPDIGYADCKKCQLDTAKPKEGKGGGAKGGAGGGFGGPGGGGGTGGGSGPGGGGPCHDDSGRGIEAKLCSVYDARPKGPGPAASLWICESSIPEEDSIVRILGYCYEISATAKIEPIPEGVNVAWVSGSYENCADCAGGIRAVPCPDQEDFEGYDDLPELWVRLIDVPDDPIIFEYRNFCFQIDPADKWQVIPPDGIILNPRATLEDCSQCRMGVRAIACQFEENQGDPPELWIREEDLPRDLPDQQDGVFFKYDGYCYFAPEYNEGMTLERMPPDANLQMPRDSFEDCDACFCDAAKAENGYPAYLCWQPAHPVTSAPDLWVPVDEVPNPPPSDTMVFKHGETCYYVDTTEDPRPISDGALVTRMDFRFDNCRDCADGGGMDDPGDPFDPGGFEHDPPPLPPIPPFFLFGVVPCGQAPVLANVVGWTDGILYPPGFVYKNRPGQPLANQCVQVTNLQKDEKEVKAAGEPQVSFPGAERFLCCEPCEGDWWYINKCYAEGPGTEYNTTTDLALFENKVVKIQEKDGCWSVRKGGCFNFKAPGVPIAVTVTETYDSCPVCEGWWKLRQCDGAREVITQTDLFSYQGKVIEYDDRCWQVQLIPPPDPPEDPVPVTVDDEFDSCDACLGLTPSSSSSSHSASIKPPMAAAGGGGFGTGLV